MFEVGNACEILWQEEISKTLEAEKARLFSEEAELDFLWERVRKVPVSSRKWFRQKGGASIHKEDIDSELALLTTKECEDKPLSRVITLSAKPPRGTEKKIKEKVAKSYNIKPKQVEYLWRLFKIHGFD